MDQLSAHLDRGWDLIQKGDAAGAEHSARRALDLDDESPEAHNLLGYVAALHGNFERALEHYREALELDDTYLEAMLNAAEVLVYPFEVFDEALALCGQALELADGDNEVIDILLLQFDALLGKGDTKAARKVAARFPQGPFENPMHQFLLGRAYFEVGELETAAPVIEDAAKASLDNPEVFYYLGMIRDELGDTAGATEAFLRVRQLDALMAPLPWSLSQDTFQDMVTRVVTSLANPEEPNTSEVADYDLYVSDLPGVEVIVSAVDPRAAVLVEQPLTEGLQVSEHPPHSEEIDKASCQNKASIPGRIFVYQSNVERMAASVERIETELRAALTRELAHCAESHGNNERNAKDAAESISDGSEPTSNQANDAARRNPSGRRGSGSGPPRKN